MALKKYITESERAVAFPVTGDVLEVVVREDFDDEIAIDFPVVEHTDDSITLHLDEYAYGILEGCNYVGDTTEGTIDPPSEDLDEGMGQKCCCKYCGDELYGEPKSNCSYDINNPDTDNWIMVDIDKDGDADIAISNEGYRSVTNEGIVKVTNIKWDAEDDVSDLSTTMTVPVPVGLDDEDAEEFIADYLTDKTGITHDGFRIAEETVSTTQKGYRSITNEGTLMERIKDGKIYCPDACCGTKVMDCTCGAKCPHCNCMQIQKLAGEVKMFEEQALLYKRMGVPSSAEYYTRKLTETKAQVEKLVEDVEDVEAMITRRIMNHPEFSDMVRQYGIEQITQAITDTAEFHGDDDDEIGSSDISAMVNDTIRSLKRVVEADIAEAEYQGRKVKLNKPMQGDVKKFKVYVKDPKTGNVKKVNFGHGGTSAKGKSMRIRKNNPKARKSFRARHNCDNPGPKTKARYWSCRKW